MCEMDVNAPGACPSPDYTVTLVELAEPGPGLDPAALAPEGAALLAHEESLRRPADPWDFAYVAYGVPSGMFAEAAWARDLAARLVRKRRCVEPFTVWARCFFAEPSTCAAVRA